MDKVYMEALPLSSLLGGGFGGQESGTSKE